MAAAQPGVGAASPRLSTLDRLLPLWIGLAMTGGLVLGRVVPGLGAALSAVEVQGVSIPIAVGLLVMMYQFWPRPATTGSTPSSRTAGCWPPRSSSTGWWARH